MATISLEKPGARGAALIGGTELGTSPSNSTFFIKVIAADFDAFSPFEETTGDGDSAATFENNEMLYMTGLLRGLMIASSALGLANLTNSAKNPLAANLTYDFGGTRRLTTKLLLGRFRIRHRATAASVPVAIPCVATDSEPTEGSTS